MTNGLAKFEGGQNHFRHVGDLKIFTISEVTSLFLTITVNYAKENVNVTDW